MHKIKCWLDRFVIFQGIRTSIAKKPYIFVIFQRGSGPPAPPLDPPMLLHVICGSYRIILHVFFVACRICKLTQGRAFAEATTTTSISCLRAQMRTRLSFCRSNNNNVDFVSASSKCFECVLLYTARLSRLVWALFCSH